MRRATKRRVRRLKREVYEWTVAIVHDLFFTAVFTVCFLIFMCLFSLLTEALVPVVEFIFSF